jgi:hypothetical protein
LHVPIEPDSTHDSHAPLHALLQQTPSAQKPLAHCALVVQPPPVLTLFAYSSVSG